MAHKFSDDGLLSFSFHPGGIKTVLAQLYDLTIRKLLAVLVGLFNGFWCVPREMSLIEELANVPGTDGCNYWFICCNELRAETGG